MFSDIVLASGASLYVWVFLSQLHPPLVTPILMAIRCGWLKPLLQCAWCSGFWLSVIFVIALQWGRLDWIATPLAVLTSAALVGLAGSFTPGLDEEDE